MPNGMKGFQKGHPPYPNSGMFQKGQVPSHTFEKGKSSWIKGKTKENNEVVKLGSLKSVQTRRRKFASGELVVHNKGTGKWYAFKCLNCGKERLSYKRKKKFCDQTCYHEWCRTGKDVVRREKLSRPRGPRAKREMRICLACRNNFEVIASKRQKYCSPECYRSTLKGKKQVYKDPVLRSKRISLSLKGKPKVFAGLTKENSEMVRLRSLKESETVKKKILTGKFTPQLNLRLRKDLGFRVRSFYEANICRLLIFMKKEFGYETKRFMLSSGKIYITDLYIPDEDLIIELKPGKNLDMRKALEKPLLLKKDHPEFNIMILDRKGYFLLEEKYADIIPYWEKLSSLPEKAV